MKISIVIVNYNREKVILSCLKSLEKVRCKGHNLTTVVVDNASTDKSVELIEKYFPGVKIIKNKENLGFSQGNNLGIKYALENYSEYILLLNNDTLVEPGFLINLLESFQIARNIGIVAPKIYFAPGFEYHQNRYKVNQKGKVIWYAGGKLDWKNIAGVHEGLDEVDKGQFNQSKEVEYASGCCMLIKREVFEQIGFFDNRYFLYLEDIDFCIRAKKNKFKIFFQPKAIIWHKNLGTDKYTTRSRQAYYYTRNRLIFGFSHAPLRTKIALIRESLKFLFGGNFWQKKAVQDFYSGKFAKGSF